jgi:hypothetical protein
MKRNVKTGFVIFQVTAILLTTNIAIIGVEDEHTSRMELYKICTQFSWPPAHEDKNPRLWNRYLRESRSKKPEIMPQSPPQFMRVGNAQIQENQRAARLAKRANAREDQVLSVVLQETRRGEGAVKKAKQEAPIDVSESNDCTMLSCKG